MDVGRGFAAARCWNITGPDFGGLPVVAEFIYTRHKLNQSCANEALRVVGLCGEGAGNLQQALNRILSIAQDYRLM